ncbi:MAG: fasciclin domain-containing protein [Thermoleophilaceae bacterium]|nr:fasciclin domain-containing protein [Thermoleophilaceae bacterium]
MRSLTRRPLLAVMMMLVLGLAAVAAGGCGSDDNTSSSSDTASGESMSSTSEGVEVGGAMMTPNRDIVANASDASNVTTLVALVTQADLVETLQGKGPFTVFAPDNDAFAALPKETTDSLMKDENKKQLATILTYHVVPGEYDAAKITEIANEGGTLTTVEGGKLTPELDGDKVVIKDESGGTVTVTQADITSSNGVTHIVDGVLMPKS